MCECKSLVLVIACDAESGELSKLPVAGKPFRIDEDFRLSEDFEIEGGIF